MAIKKDTNNSGPLVIYDGSGVARAVDKSEGWGRYCFATGIVPTEVLINGKRPAVTGRTLDRMAPGLRAAKHTR